MQYLSYGPERESSRIRGDFGYYHKPRLRLLVETATMHGLNNMHENKGERAMLSNQRKKLNRIFSSLLKDSILWERSATVARIFGGRRVTDAILEALEEEWKWFLNGHLDDHPEFWSDKGKPRLFFKRAGMWLGLAIPMGEDWSRCTPIRPRRRAA